VKNVRIYCQHTLAKVEVVPRSEAEALAEALEEIRGHSGGDPIRIENIVDDALNAFRSRRPKETP
jgi:hypothetical protein